VGLERTTLLGAIARAGGFTDYADRDEVVVVRETDKGSERHTLDIAAILSGKAPDDFVLKPRDIVWVSRKGPVGP
jgi:protein involved in polysaccharide export with SLBB domain